jgi:hypothetical protein
MYNKTRLFFLSLTVVTVLIFSALGPTSVYADDGPTSGQPAAGDTTNPIDPPPAESVATSEPATVTEPAATSEPTTATEPAEPAATSEPVAVTEPAEPVATSETVIDSTLLEAVPDNTTIAVVDSNGEAQPLVAQATADAITLSDPIWCPEGQSPTPGSNGCTQSFTSFTQLLTHLQANETSYQQAGTIYVQMGNYNGGESSIDFNSYGFTTFNSYNLNIQGGWDTSGSTINTAIGSTFTTPMVIGTSVNPWGGSLSFSNIQFGNISNSTALTSYSQNDITLTDVNITNINNGNAATLGSTSGDVTISGGQFNNSTIGAEINAGGNVAIENGASFDNNKKAGAVINAGGNVDIADATFNKNGSIVNKNVDGRGLQVESGGLVTLSNTQANGNKLFGANINAANNVSITNSFFSGNKSYVSACGGSTHYGSGLQVVSLGDVSLDRVDASNNNLFGAHLEGNIYVTVANSTFNYNGFTSNSNVDGRGLEVKGNGVAILNNVQANHNSVFGANIEVPGVAVIHNSTFSGNQSYTCACGGYTAHGYGLKVVVLYGSISMDGVSTEDNYLSGAYLEAGGNVDISNSSFDANVFDKSNKVLVGSGLEIKNGGSTTLTNIHSNNNSLFGANINSGGNVTVSNSSFSGNYLYTSTCASSTSNGYGLKIAAGGSVELNQVVAENNYLFGADISTTTAGGNVSITNSSFSNNGSSNSNKVNGYGLKVDSLAGVSLSGVLANDNKLFGADVKATGTAVITNSIFSGNQAYTYSKCGGYTVYGYGLKAATDGSLVMDSITAEGNYLYGASLAATGFITVSNSNFNENEFTKSNTVTGYGLEIVKSGGVSLSGVQANDNNLFGASLTGPAVIVNNSTFNNNKSILGNTFYGYGLTVVAPGYISLDGVTANFNNLWGASLDGTEMSVTNSQFNNNVSDSYVFIDDTGLLVNSVGGNVLLDNVEAKENRLIGADIVAAGNVTITNSFFSGNKGFTCLDSRCRNVEIHGYGLKVVTPDSIVLDGVTADENNLFGASLSGSEVTITNSTFSNNGSGSNSNPTGQGLIVDSSGTVTLSGVEANYNQQFGANITAKDVVSVSNSFFSGNKVYTSSCGGGKSSGYGIQVVTPVDISLDHVTASDNGSTGAILNTSTDVVVSDSTFDHNKGTGLSITTPGHVTLTNVIATNNGIDGVDIIGSCTTTVDVENGTYSNNSKYGIKAVKAVVNLSGSPVFSNNPSGNLFVDNSACSGNTGGNHGNSGGSGSHHHHHDHDNDRNKDCHSENNRKGRR